MRIQHGMIKGENVSALRRACPIAILSTKNPTWTTLELNPCLYGKKLATSHLRYEMASLLSRILRKQGKIIYKDGK
jgi:hypothetical protein